MRELLRKVTIVYSSGLLGGLANRIIVWSFGVFGITHVLGVKMAPALNVRFVYPGMIWGGIWGLIFLLPFFKRSWFIKGLVYSLGPSAVMMFVIFPLRLHNGIAGLDLGTMMPVLVLFFNAVWGITASGWLHIIRSE